MTKRKCLVTGGMGYVGQVVVRRLALSGWEVVVSDPNPFRMRLPLGAVKRLGGVHSLSPADVEGFDCVIHLAGLADVRTCEERPDLAWLGNVEITERVSDLVADSGVPRVVYAGTEAVYESNLGKAASERAKVAPISVYAQTKLQGEAMLFDRLTDRKVVSLRQGTVCGPSPRIRLDLVLNAMASSGIHKGVVGVNVTAPVDRSLVHTSDLADAYALAAFGHCEPGIYNCGGWSGSIPDVGTEVKRQVEAVGIPVRVDEWTDVKDTRSYTMSSRKLRSEGWSPLFARLPDCVSDTVSFIRGSVRDPSHARHRNGGLDYEAILVT